MCNEANVGNPEKTNDCSSAAAAAAAISEEMLMAAFCQCEPKLCRAELSCAVLPSAHQQGPGQKGGGALCGLKP